MAKRLNIEYEDVEQSSDKEVEAALDAFFLGNEDSGRWTSQDIVENLRGTIKASVMQVFSYMSKHGYKLERQDDRLVWVID